MVVLEPMSPDEFHAFVERSVPGYAASHVAAGNWDADGSLERSRAEHHALLPRGLDTPGHYLWVVRERTGGERVGELWYQLNPEGDRADLYIFWIGIDEPFRRRGYASEVLALVEAKGRAAGAQRIGLHVFAENTGAQALYTEAGFRPTGLSMVKRLGAPPG